MAKRKEQILSTQKTRKPVQERGIKRRSEILSAAVQIISETGTTGATAHKIAERANLPASSVYQYFPKPEMIFEVLAEQRASDMIEHLKKEFAGRDFDNWWQMYEIVAKATCEFYRDDPVNARLFLGMDAAIIVRLGAASRLTRFAEWFCEELESRFIVTDLRGMREPLAISVNVFDAALSRSISLYGETRPQYFDEAKEAVFGYLNARIEPNVKKRVVKAT